MTKCKVKNKITKKEVVISACIVIVSLSVASLLGLVITGATIAWGPFQYLYNWQKDVDKVLAKYDVNTHQNEIVFYGASNFRLWTEMEDDLSNYYVQNHGFGGSTDKLLVKYADQILYPYNPKIVFLQTGSNDYVSMEGSVQDIAMECVAYKIDMYETFHKELPDTKFVVMAGVLMPGRDEYTDIVIEVNKQIKEYCKDKDYIWFCGEDEFTYVDGQYLDMFIDDGIHLTHEARLIWRDRYILPMIEYLVSTYNITTVTK